MSSSGVLLVANLDCETEFAQLHLELERDTPVGSRTLPRSTLETASALGTLMRACSVGPDDVLWLPASIDPERIVELRGLPRPEIASEVWPPDGSFSGVIAWGTTRTVQSLGLPLLGSPEATARVNHRGFCLEVARQLGFALPHSRILRSVEELARHIETAPRTRGDEVHWVVKSPFSAAGRSRVIGEGRALDKTDAKRVANLLEAQGCVLFEPWMDRVADFGYCASLNVDGDIALSGWHELEVDAHGRFSGICLRSTYPPFDLGQVEDTVERVLEHAAAEGYAGPVAIDFWTYRDADGKERLHPLGEINARLSFGWLARNLQRRLSRAHDWIERRGMRLRVGDTTQESEAPERLPLLRPDETGRHAAWLEPAC